MTDDHGEYNFATSSLADHELGCNLARRLVVAIIMFRAETIHDLPSEVRTEILESESVRFGMSSEVALEIFRRGPTIETVHSEFHASDDLLLRRQCLRVEPGFERSYGPRREVAATSDSYFFVCPGCNSRIDPQKPGVVYAVEEIEQTAGSGDPVEGLPAFFHLDCFRRQGDGWRRIERPENV